LSLFQADDCLLGHSQPFKYPWQENLSESAKALEVGNKASYFPTQSACILGPVASCWKAADYWDEEGIEK
jgi:hypothetical protein